MFLVKNKDNICTGIYSMLTFPVCNSIRGIEMLMILTDSHGGYACHSHSRVWIDDGTVMRVLI